jgi:hypothetical protein
LSARGFTISALLASVVVLLFFRAMLCYVLFPLF